MPHRYILDLQDSLTEDFIHVYKRKKKTKNCVFLFNLRLVSVFNQRFKMYKNSILSQKVIYKVMEHIKQLKTYIKLDPEEQWKQFLNKLSK